MNLTIRPVALTLLALLALGCAHDSAIEPIITQVEIEPHNVPTLLKGRTVTLSAVVLGDASARVLWYSRDHTVALVTPAGVVSGQAAGNSWIVAVAQGAFSSMADSVQVTVVDSMWVEIPGPMIVIEAIRSHATGLSIDTSKVSDTIDVLVRHDVYLPLFGNVTANVLLGTQPACAFAVVQQSAVSTCTIDTAERAADGQRKYANGAATVRATLVRSDGVIVALATSLPFNISNP